MRTERTGRMAVVRGSRTERTGRMAVVRGSKSDSSELLAVGIFGQRSRIGDRIETLLRGGRTFSARVSRRIIAAGTLVLGGLLLAGSFAPRLILFEEPAFAQDARPAFEVASVKPNKSGEPSTVREINPNGLRYQNRTLAEYIWIAWNVQPWQLSRGSNVQLTDRYDIEARTAAPVPEAQIRLMLRSLLEDRFKLAVHTETREVQAFELRVADGGPRFQRSESDGSMNAVIRDGKYRLQRTSMAYLAGSVLTNMPSLGRPVVDRTGLEGLYDFSLRLYDPDPARAAVNPKGDTRQQLDNGLSASLKDLGLKLDSRKVPVEYLIVDHVEKPEPN